MPSTSPRKSTSATGRGGDPKPAGAEKPFLRVHHSEALRKKTLAVLDELESADDATSCRELLADLVVELTRHGMDGFFLVPLQHAKAGFIIESSAKLGMAGVQQVMASVARNVVGRMDHAQLLSVSSSIRGFMR
jgi:hypothetical protein